MNKKGITILELLLSISLVSVILLFLVQVMLTLEKMNHDVSYASDDEILRTQIIKEVEEDFMQLKLNGLRFEKKEKEMILHFQYENDVKDFIIEENAVTYQNKHTLKSSGATYDLCVFYDYQELEDNYYLLTIRIPVKVNNQKETQKDDLVFTYMGLKNEFSSYPEYFTC